VNHEARRQIAIGYYRETILSESELIYLGEGIVEIFIPSNVDDKIGPRVNPIKTRRRVFVPLPEEYIMGGNASDMVLSCVWRPDGFMSYSGMKNYFYSYDGYCLVGDRAAFVIAFEPKSGGKFYRGNIYLEEGTMAILRIEYKPDLRKGGFWKNVSWIESYDDFGGYFSLSSVEYSGMSFDGMFTYRALLVLTETGELQGNDGWKMFKLTTKDPFYLNASDNFGDNFWEGFNTVVLESFYLKALVRDGF
jgi:hypothetical protein